MAMRKMHLKLKGHDVSQASWVCVRCEKAYPLPGCKLHNDMALCEDCLKALKEEEEHGIVAEDCDDDEI